jgi:hypothetical protein
MTRLFVLNGSFSCAWMSKYFRVAEATNILFTLGSPNVAKVTQETQIEQWEISQYLKEILIIDRVYMGPFLFTHFPFSWLIMKITDWTSFWFLCVCKQPIELSCNEAALAITFRVCMRFFFLSSKSAVPKKETEKRFVNIISLYVYHTIDIEFY